jgi:hypothetical protein
MPTTSAPTTYDAARRVLRTTANAWRLKAPARRSVRTGARTRARTHARALAGAVADGMRSCPMRLGFPLAGYGLAFAY